MQHGTGVVTTYTTTIPLFQLGPTGDNMTIYFDETTGEVVDDPDPPEDVDDDEDFEEEDEEEEDELLEEMENGEDT